MNICEKIQNNLLRICLITHHAKFFDLRKMPLKFKKFSVLNNSCVLLYTYIYNMVYLRSAQLGACRLSRYT